MQNELRGRGAIVKESQGTCLICNATVAKAHMTVHLRACLSDMEGRTTGATIKLFHIIAEGLFLPEYWIHLLSPGAFALGDLDYFLRNMWLECCDHLSCFTIKGQSYSIHPRKNIFGAGEKSMNVKLYRVLENGLEFQHEYDYGTPTVLKLKAADFRAGRMEEPSIFLMARNLAPDIVCITCGAPAVRICPLCSCQRASFCEGCAAEHPCSKEGESLLPIVNSPRTGLCGYCGS